MSVAIQMSAALFVSQPRTVVAAVGWPLHNFSGKNTFACVAPRREVSLEPHNDGVRHREAAVDTLQGPITFDDRDDSLYEEQNTLDHAKASNKLPTTGVTLVYSL